jgi:hypothetical protein
VEHVVLEVKVSLNGVKSFHHFVHGFSTTFNITFSTKKEQIFSILTLLVTRIRKSLEIEVFKGQLNPNL